MPSTDAPEVFSWMEMSGAIYPLGGTQTAIVYARDVELAVTKNWRKDLNMNTGVGTAQRFTYTLIEQAVRVTVGKLFTGPSLFQAFMSGTAFNADFYWGQSALSNFYTAHFNIWSAAITEWRIASREGAMWEGQVVFDAADMSGV